MQTLSWPRLHEPSAVQQPGDVEVLKGLLCLAELGVQALGMHSLLL